ncbi:MAG: hypothetical protein HRU82_01995 [Nitrospira sp.]|nr:MAG: hypothetical protein HRU82_01995 [Nitrospira sp.]
MVAIVATMVFSSQVVACSLLWPAFDGSSCGNVAARNDLREVATKELIKNGWPAETAPLIKTRVSSVSDISKNSSEYKCHANVHTQVGERTYEGFNFGIYYNYDNYKLTDYKSTFDEGQRRTMADMLAGKMEPRAQKMKTCSQAEKAAGCRDGRDRLQ